MGASQKRLAEMLALTYADIHGHLLTTFNYVVLFWQCLSVFHGTDVILDIQFLHLKNRERTDTLVETVNPHSMKYSY